MLPTLALELVTCMGNVIRQHRATDYADNFMRKPAVRRSPPGQASTTAKSVFDDVEPYELTELGSQFVHYAMNEIVAKIAFKEHADVYSLAQRIYRLL
jgi:hypothetical protein